MCGLFIVVMNTDRDNLTLRLPSFPLIFSLEGSIAAGKTTVLQSIKRQYLAWNIFYEPLHLWEENDLLENFYKFPDQFCYSLQRKIFASYLDLYQEVTTLVAQQQQSLQPIIIERGTRSATRVFSRLARQKNYLTLEQYNFLLSNYRNTFQLAFDLKINYIYIKSDPQVCFQRMLNRNRQSEVNSIALPYLIDLNCAYEQEFIPLTKSDFVTSAVVQGIELSVADKSQCVINIIQEYLQNHGARDVNSTALAIAD